MVVRKVNRDTFDVWTSAQYWDGWTRVRFGNKGLYRVDGKRVNNKTLADMEAAINGVNK